MSKTPPEPVVVDEPLTAYEHTEINRCALDGAIKVMAQNSPDEVLAAAEKFAAFIRGDKTANKEDGTDGK